MKPVHAAIIMDGNGRWALNRRHPRFYGHIRGAKRVREIVREASLLEFGALTLFAFSTENWSRPLVEQELLWKLFQKFLNDEIDELDANNIRFYAMGEIAKLSPHLQIQIEMAERRLSKNTGMILTLAVSYGGRMEILEAAKQISRDCMNGVLSRTELENLTEADFSKRLWTNSIPGFGDVDLLIRTSGELRVSNFMLWQIAYAEMFFSPIYWPDFTAAHLREIFKTYQLRNRRFGHATPVSFHEAGL